MGSIFTFVHRFGNFRITPVTKHALVEARDFLNLFSYRKYFYAQRVILTDFIWCADSAQPAMTIFIKQDWMSTKVKQQTTFFLYIYQFIRECRFAVFKFFLIWCERFKIMYFSERLLTVLLTEGLPIDIEMKLMYIKWLTFCEANADQMKLMYIMWQTICEVCHMIYISYIWACVERNESRNKEYMYFNIHSKSIEISELSASTLDRRN